MRNIIFAFPGMGKTPTCKRLTNCMDLDFGMFRSALGVSKDGESKLFSYFWQLILEYLKEDWKVFTNEPKLIPYLFSNFPNYLTSELKKNMVMYLPIGNGIKYCAKKLGVDETTASEWVNDWKMIAHKFGIKCIEIETGLDHYLNAN